VAATDVMHGRPCYEVEFSDGTVIVADAQHQWLTETGASRRSAATGHQGSAGRRAAAEVRTTEEIAATLHDGPRHTIANAEPLDLPDRALAIPPYTLGARLGASDGNGGDQHIPAEYLRASEAQRRALLAGLLDTAGDIDGHGTVRLTVKHQRLAEDAWELILSLGYTATRTPEAGHAITFTPPDKVFGLTHQNARVVTAADPEATCRYITYVRPVPSVPVRCVEVDNADHLYVAGRTWIPTHNSTLGLDFARSAAIKHGMTTVIFSLEMSRNEITMRLLSAEARVALHTMRSGMMGDDDWTRLARRMSEVAEAPLFIDDSPNMSMMEIRAKCRRLKQRNDLKFVVIDYLQLMSSPKKTESRQNEVSEISRAIKLLAKELEVPVIAISQLNRGPEQRTDKRPAVSDLRESGCLTAATRVMRADTGAEVSLGELLESGARDIPVWSLDDRLKLVPRTMTHVFPSGVKQVYRVRLRSGREVESTANHPFLTYDGWRALEDLPPGTRVAVARHVPAPLGLAEQDEADVADLVALAHRPAESLPESLFSLPRRQLAGFLSHLWTAGGSVRWDRSLGQARLSYFAAGRRLADDVARLLLRFNVMTRVEGGDRTGYRLLVHGAADQLRFLDEIGLRGEQARPAEECAAQLRRLTGETVVDTVPDDVWSRIRAALTERKTVPPEPATAAQTRASVPSPSPSPSGPSPRPSGPSGWAARGRAGDASTPGERRERLGRIAAVLDNSDLELLATNDVFWDEIVTIEPMGEQPVYDATVLGTHNFLANGISLHNSIEQDADMVILLHREDAYERESPRAGEADLIVAKHRNGPTATVTVAFQGHYSRFVDMAQH
jgi:replicative DNA helicase